MSDGKHQRVKSRQRPVHHWKPASPSLLIHSPASSRPVDTTPPAKTTATCLPNLNSCWFSSAGAHIPSPFPQKMLLLGQLLPGFLLYPCSSIPKVQPKNLRKDAGHARKRTAATGAHLQKTSEEVPQTTLGGQCQARYGSSGPRAFVCCHHQD